MRPETREQLRTALEEVLAVVRARPRRHDHLQRLSRLRAIARGYARAPTVDAVRGMRRLASLINDTTDDFASRSHVLLSLVNLVASICLVVDEFAEMR